MPIVYIDAPPGLQQEKKETMMKKITDAVEDAYRIGDTLIFVREHAPKCCDERRATIRKPKDPRSPKKDRSRR